MGPSRLASSLIACLVALFVAASLQGQAVPTARRSSSISLYAGGQVVSTDYNSNDKGFIVGGDFTRYFRYVSPSLDLRFNKATGDTVGEKSFLGGIKLEKPFGRFRPYVDFMYGYGVITFNTPGLAPNGKLLYYDDSVIKNFGGGVDISVTHLFSVKVDGQYQLWKLGVNESLAPAIASVGIVFNVPYRNLRPHRK